MLKIRLSRSGKKAQPAFRVVVQEHTSPIKGKFVEELGIYRPATQDKEFKINLDRAKYWLSVGATPSDSLAVLFKKHGIENMEKYIAPRNKKRKSKKAVEEAPAAPAAAPAPVQAAAPAPAPTPAPEVAATEAETPAEAPAPEAAAPAEAAAEEPAA